MTAPIPTLRGSITHALAVTSYHHQHDDAGGCARCQHRARCPVQRNAAAVIAAAGEDPPWYNSRLSPHVQP